MTLVFPADGAKRTPRRPVGDIAWRVNRLSAATLSLDDVHAQWNHHTMRARGYGADLELAGDALVIHAGKVAATIQASPTVTIPLTDIVHIEWKDAGILTNGHIHIIVADGADLSLYGPRPNAINPQSLVVHWRRRDRDAFTTLRRQLNALIPEQAWAPRSSKPIKSLAMTQRELPPKVERPPKIAQSASRTVDDEKRLRDMTAKARHGEVALRAFELWGGNRSVVEVVGESFHRAELAKLYKLKGRRSGEEFWTEATLVPEVGNIHDANAVRVDVEGQTVGHLAREDAVRYRPVLVRLVVGGQGAVVKARVWATRDDGTWRGRVTLRLGDPGSIIPINAHPGERAAELPEGRSIQVTGEENHLDVLGPLVADHKVALWCTLRALTVKTARSEKRVVEVHVDNQPVGTLTPATSADLLTVVDRAETIGRSIVAHGFLSGNSLTVTMILSIPRAAELTEDWISEHLSSTP